MHNYLDVYMPLVALFVVFFFQAEDGIRDADVTVLQTFFFFFSSRRRHTRCGRDWSSDVCSSDLSGCIHAVHVSGPSLPARFHNVDKLAYGQNSMLLQLGMSNTAQSSDHSGADTPQFDCPFKPLQVHRLAEDFNGPQIESLLQQPLVRAR